MGYYLKYYSYGLPTFLIIVIALYLLFTGNSTFVGGAAVISDILSTQALEKLSMWASSWKNQVPMHGLPWGSVCVLD
jgi:hypothetical protein